MARNNKMLLALDDLEIGVVKKLQDKSGLSASSVLRLMIRKYAKFENGKVVIDDSGWSQMTMFKE